MKQITIDAEDTENIKHENTQQRTFIWHASCQKKISSKNNCDIQTTVKGHKTQNVYLDNCQKQNFTTYLLQSKTSTTPEAPDRRRSGKPINPRVMGSRGDTMHSSTDSATISRNISKIIQSLFFSLRQKTTACARTSKTMQLLWNNQAK